jgi:NAD-dependent DNA ligase
MDKYEAYDSMSFKRFTLPQELDKAIHTLEGIITGISIDNIIEAPEIQPLLSWCRQYEYARNKSPFNELIERLEESLKDGVFTEEEQKDILWLCNKITSKNAYYNIVTSDMQRLQGILIGIAADGKIEKAELEALSVWLDEHDSLKSCWPYDEIYSLTTSVLSDHKIDEKEHRFLLAYFNEFLKSSANLLVEPKIDDDLIQQGVCAMCPEIQFDNRVFCFTGQSKRASRKELSQKVTELKGFTTPNMRKDVHYLVIGNKGNTCWAFSCYGRKVEEAISLRKQGAKIQLVNENDFWDAVEDAKMR